MTVGLINDGSDEWKAAGSLNAVGLLEGGHVNGGMLYINGESDLYIVTLAEALFDFNFNTVTAEYQIGAGEVEE